MKTIPSDLLAHYGTGCLTTAVLWKVTRTDGLVFAFTDHDRELTFGGTTYSPSSAFDASTIATSSELNVDNLEVAGILDAAGITAADIEAGLWDGASVEVRRVNWADLADGAEILRVGSIGQVQRRTGGYTAELRGLMQALQKNVGRVIMPTCDATLGDARCGVNLPALAVTGSVTTATSRRAFTDSAIAAVAGYFDGGEIEWTSGANDGIRMDVKTQLSGGVVELALPMPYDIAVSDAFTIRPGCDKRKTTCGTKFSNVVNFRGFSFVPGPDETLKVGG